MTTASTALFITGSARGQIGKLLSTPVRLPGEGRLPTLEGATGWLNSRPLTGADLRGKVVLIDVWTYTCINWIRTLPYVRAWAEKYKDQGLVVIGVHSPEFEFEKNVDNIRRAATAMQVSHPIAIDSDFAIWRALNNNTGQHATSSMRKDRSAIVHFGEGEYAQVEMIIKQLLAEAGAATSIAIWFRSMPDGAEAPADWRNLRSPETYVGYGRTENFSSTGRAVLDKRHAFAAPARLSLNHWALSGDWTLRKEFAALNAPNGRIAYRFHARDLHLVMGPRHQGRPCHFGCPSTDNRRAPIAALTSTKEETDGLRNSGCTS